MNGLNIPSFDHPAPVISSPPGAMSPPNGAERAALELLATQFSALLQLLSAAGTLERGRQA